jgi:uncharacterized protein (TIGR02118 family)
MIKVCILYPNQPGARFDRDYYLQTHMPMAVEKLSPALKSASIDFGLNGGLPAVPAPYIVVCNLFFETIEAFYGAFMPNMQSLQGDMPNYTDVIPVVVISDVVSVL